MTPFGVPTDLYDSDLITDLRVSSLAPYSPQNVLNERNRIDFAIWPKVVDFRTITRPAPKKRRAVTRMR